VAHVGGGVWTRGNLYVGNSTISNNYRARSAARERRPS
jgi:hypothetical protein